MAGLWVGGGHDAWWEGALRWAQAEASVSCSACVFLSLQGPGGSGAVNEVGLWRHLRAVFWPWESVVWGQVCACVCACVFVCVCVRERERKREEACLHLLWGVIRSDMSTCSVMAS